MSNGAIRRSFLRGLFGATIARLDPARAVASGLETLDYAQAETWIVALGKAAHAMARGALAYLDGRALEVRGGVVVAPAQVAIGSGARARDEMLGRGLALLESAHPVPDERSMAAARALLDVVRRAPASGHVLALVSGGGSALAALPVAGISLAQKVATTRALAERGATIQELNTVRRHLSAIKGGGLARASRARITTLVASDVVGDDLATVASGPTLRDASTRADARALVERILGWQGVPEAVRAHLEGRAHDGAPDGRRGDRSLLVAGTDALVDAALEVARERGVRAEILARGMTGDVHQVGAVVGDAARALMARREGICLVAGGEPTLALPGSYGRGGRAQHLALWLARELAGVADISVLCAGSDGIDGTSEAAGAIVDGSTWAALGAASVDGERALRAYDSGTALAAIDAQVVTGPTGVNHADLVVVMAGAPPG